MCNSVPGHSCQGTCKLRSHRQTETCYQPGGNTLHILNTRRFLSPIRPYCGSYGQPARSRQTHKKFFHRICRVCLILFPFKPAKWANPFIALFFKKDPCRFPIFIFFTIMRHMGNRFGFFIRDGVKSVFYSFHYIKLLKLKLSRQNRP